MTAQTKQIALYGKGGIGKSTIACNVSIALQEMGHMVMQVGCSPKIDSTCFLLGGEPPDHTVLDYHREVGVSEENILDVVFQGYKGIWCVEAGGPAPAEGCAGRGTALALDMLKQYQVAERLGVDFIIYDVIADVVCGGFAQPMRAGYASDIYLASSGELMSLYSANNICSAICTIAQTKSAVVGVAGLLNNMRGVEGEADLVAEFAQRVGVPLAANIPRSALVQEAEAQGGTVLELFPDSPQAGVYRALAKNILEHNERFIPKPMELEELLELLRKHQVSE